MSGIIENGSWVHIKFLVISNFSYDNQGNDT